MVASLFDNVECATQAMVEIAKALAEGTFDKAAAQNAAASIKEERGNRCPCLAVFFVCGSGLLIVILGVLKA